MKQITRKKPVAMLYEEEMLSRAERSIIQNLYKMEKYTVYDHNGIIWVNPDLNDSEKLVKMIDKLFMYQTMNDNASMIFDEIEQLADKKTCEIILMTWKKWREELESLKLHEQAEKALEEARSKRIYNKSRKEKEIIKRLYEIGKGESFNIPKGIENVFMYGYLLGMKAKRKV